MNKIIGGLLVATLLARPALLRVDFVAYEIYKAHSRLIAIVRKEDEQLQVIEEKDIDEILTNIDTNKRHIVRLMKDKNRVYGQIQMTMQTKAMSRERMTEEQIDAYRQFTQRYGQEQAALNDQMAKMDAAIDLHETQKEISKLDTDINYLYKELKGLHDRQHETIFSLSGIIDMSKQTLVCIC